MWCGTGLDRSEPPERGFCRKFLGRSASCQRGAVSESSTPPPSRSGRLWARARSSAWLGLVAAAGLIATQTVDFSPPERVRLDAADTGTLVGEAPPQSFAAQLDNPQAVQLRATLRLYPDPSLDLTIPDPEMMAAGRLLSQPVVTTIYGMNATVNQTIRLEGGDLNVDLIVDATPRLARKPRRGKPAPPVVVEYEITVRSRRTSWWEQEIRQRVHLDTAGFLNKVDEHGHRVIFVVDQHLFSLELELHRPDVATESTLAAGR